MTATISEKLLSAFSEYVAGHMGLAFPPERKNDLKRGLKRAAAELGFEDAESCAQWFMKSSLSKSQTETLASHLTVGETYFFRDRTIFDLLEGQILPELIRKRRDSDKNLRIWSAGCATGEEPYSIAILLGKMLPDIHDWNITILGTDINPTFLRKASLGAYSEWSFRNVSLWEKNSYFQKKGKSHYKVPPEIRKHVTFSYHNLVEDPYPSLLNNTNAMDIIFCRNVLMYFSRDHQQNVVKRLCSCLVEGGLLVVSSTEMSSVHCSPLLGVRFTGVALFQKKIQGEALPVFTQLKPFPIKESKMPVPFTPFVSNRVKEFFPAESIPEPITSSGLEEAVNRSSDLYQRALAFYEKGRYDDAEEKLKPLLTDNANVAPALALLSRISANKGRLEHARELCEKAIAADKMNPGHQYLHATILQELGLAQESVVSLTRALYLDQNFVLAHFSLGISALHQGHIRESKKHFKNACMALRHYAHDDILPESEGVTAGRMEEIILAALKEEVPA
jgi:chemotaxis protein methyltransferase CheR